MFSVRVNKEKQLISALEELPFFSKSYHSFRSLVKIMRPLAFLPYEHVKIKYISKRATKLEFTKKNPHAINRSSSKLSSALLHFDTKFRRFP